MLICLYRFGIELQTRSKSVKDVTPLFEVAQSNTLLLVHIKEFKLATSKCTGFHDEISEIEFILGIPSLRKRLKAANVKV